jgi:hypothetical protein
MQSDHDRDFLFKKSHHFLAFPFAIREGRTPPSSLKISKDSFSRSGVMGFLASSGSKKQSTALELHLGKVVKIIDLREMMLLP